MTLTSNEILAILANQTREYFNNLLKEKGIESTYYNLKITLELIDLGINFQELKKSILIDESQK